LPEKHHPYLDALLVATFRSVIAAAFVYGEFSKIKFVKSNQKSSLWKEQTKPLLVTGVTKYETECYIIFNPQPMLPTAASNNIAVPEIENCHKC
jgi:hypothetical protein